MLTFFASTARGAEAALVAELQALGACAVKPQRGGVEFSGDLELAYHVSLQAFGVSRLLLELARFAAADDEQLYAGVQAIDWSEHLAADGTLAVDATLRSSALTHSHYAALRVKDAIVDQFRTDAGQRPSVDLRAPDVRINLYLNRNQARLALDFSGSGRCPARGGRERLPPLTSTLAAALLREIDWPARAAAGEALVDVNCGSATLLVDAVLMATGAAPGLLEPRFGFERWQGHRPALWTRSREAQAALPTTSATPVVGVVASARAKADLERDLAVAGCAHLVRLTLGALPAPPADRGVCVRVDDGGGQAEPVRELGDALRGRYRGWDALVYAARADLARAARIKPSSSRWLYRGRDEWRMLVLSGSDAQAIRPRGSGGAVPEGAPATVEPVAPSSEGARMLCNRLRKNQRHLGRWARRSGVDCYRLYDADLPEYAAAADIYQADQTWVVVQEYAAPAEVPEAVARQRLCEVLGAVVEVTQVPAGRVVLKRRERKRGAAQYEKHAEAGTFHAVQEDGLSVWVNFTDYLDTGLFLDHRLTRAMLRARARGRDALNLFAYTGVASVHMAAGGARSTTTVDMSATYLNWARRNMQANGFGGTEHEYVQADCLAWLEEAARKPGRYGLIFLDPPTFSTSKRMAATLDVQRDHVDLIRAAGALLTDGGELLFSNNYRRFKLDARALAGFSVDDITAQTVPEDFKRNPRIHQAWVLRRR